VALGVGYFFLSDTAQAQGGRTPATFEVASIRHRTNRNGPTDTLIAPDGERFTARNAPLTALLLFAYKYIPWQISGGPDWVGAETFDVQAKAEKPVDDAQIRLMLQRLLADRFSLKLQQTTREVPVYALGRGNSSAKLKQSASESKMQVGRGAAGQFVFRNTPVFQLCYFLSIRLGRNVIDETELTGAYDFEFAWTPDLPRRPGGVEAVQPVDADGPWVFSAVRDQLGLALKSTKRPTPFIVIESAQEPIEN
jgi:uncharacterized protein (TIGR03435 family)